MRCYVLNRLMNKPAKDKATEYTDPALVAILLHVRSTKGSISLFKISLLEY